MNIPPDPHPRVLELDELRGRLAGRREQIDVRWNGSRWLVNHASLRNPLSFDNLDDAEQRASELAHKMGVDVVVFDEEGDLVDRLVVRGH
jgi:hypothetical protein